MNNKIYSITKECMSTLGNFTEFEIKDGSTTLIKDSFDGIGLTDEECKSYIVHLLEKVNIYTLERLNELSFENDLSIKVNDDIVTFGNEDFSNCTFKRYDNYFYKQMEV